MDRKHAQRLYRAQNTIWLWLGVAAFVAMFAYFFRPALGPVETTQSPVIDTIRVVTFGLGGLGIAIGVWWIRRIVEVMGHLSFSTGAIISATAEVVLHANAYTVILTASLAAVSALRVWYIVAWIGAGKVTAVVPDAPIRD